MAKPIYVKFEVPKELQDKILSVVEKAKESGKIKKGTNEVTKAIERNEAKFVVVAEDVNPPEVVAHVPLLCDEKGIVYGFVSTMKDLGSKIGLKSTASVAILDLGKGEESFKNVSEEISKIKK